jgi:hypothetical protein
LDSGGEIFISGTKDKTMSGKEQAESCALFFDEFISEGHLLPPTVLAYSGENGIQQRDGSGVRGAERG